MEYTGTSLLDYILKNEPEFLDYVFKTQSLKEIVAMTTDKAPDPLGIVGEPFTAMIFDDIADTPIE